MFEIQVHLLLTHWLAYPEVEDRRRVHGNQDAAPLQWGLTQAFEY
jgi:hypothetical protein